MRVSGKNECIKCTIKNCAYNAQTEMNPTKKECTDCESFVNKVQ